MKPDASPARGGCRAAALGMLGAALLALAMPMLASAALSEDALLDRGIEAYGNGRFVDAVMYLYAYQERSPRLLQEDPAFNRQLTDAVAYSRRRLDEEQTELADLRRRLAAQQHADNIGSSVSGLKGTPPPLARPLAVPQQVSPSSGVIFDHYPRTTVLTWHAVPAAAGYGVEVDCYQCCQAGKWCTEVGRHLLVQENINATTFQFNFVGAQAGRWRVWAVDAQGHRGPSSPWWDFAYTK
jgi:hypothetical protein